MVEAVSELPPAGQIDRFLRTGDHDPLFADWPGRNVLERAVGGSEALRDALIAQVRQREAAVTVRLPAALAQGDFVPLTRAKVGPMVRGLFTRREAGPVLALLERAVVFLGPGNIEAVIRKEKWLETAWEVANLYLGSIGARVLSEDGRCAVGISVGTTCYVSLEYFTVEDPFADFVVHEAAHVFHDTKRRTAGLKQTRRREWLLPIDFGMRETFAYACEAYSRILRDSRRPADRQALLEKLKETPPPQDDRLDLEVYLPCVEEAVSRRNGWKAILEACSPKDARFRQPERLKTEA